MPPKIFTKFVIRGKCPLQKLVPNFAIAKVSSERFWCFFNLLGWAPFFSKKVFNYVEEL
jgi:hypothetical protein